MANYTNEQLTLLKNAYARGVLEIREGDTWLKYQTLSQMRQAIRDMEAELSTANAPPRGSRVVSVKKGYY